MKTIIRFGWGRFVLLGLLLQIADPAFARNREVEIVNETLLPIYKLFIWPSELVPRTYNSLDEPIRMKDSRTVKVEDIYNDCIYTVQADTTEPPKKTRVPSWRARKKKDLGKLYILEKIDLCKPSPKITIR